MDAERCRPLCDAMLGKLARWLRAAGYDAASTYGIDDEDLLARARAERRVLLTSDGPLMAHRLIRDGTIRAVFVPLQLDAVQQLRHVLRRLGLPLADPRCMACGGALEEVDKSAVAEEVPPRAYAAYDHYRRCTRCGKLYWPGTHWARIQAALERVGDDTTPAVKAPTPPANSADHP